MRIGVQLPEVEREVRWPELRQLAVAAEEAGFESVWVGDHLLYRGDGRPERGPWDCWTTLAGLAVATERVRIGPLVACTAFREPGLLARAAAAVDELSGRRLVVALGSGWNEAEFTAFGLPFDRRVARFAEAFEIVRRLLAGERVTFDGAFHRADDAVLLPPPDRRPPLMVGANAPRMLELTLPHVDVWNTWFSPYGNRADGFARANAGIDEACERVGRDPSGVERSACVLVRVGPGGGERPDDPEAPHLEAAGLRAELDGLAQAGADEAILVLDPIDEASIRELGALLFDGAVEPTPPDL
jgi:alkanesulfonate monooxygenase SsuD/methylene tetrahydromethanopterin reductase-like flavin-dependent oxidoreductase (luciferase family)